MNLGGLLHAASIYLVGNNYGLFHNCSHSLAPNTRCNEYGNKNVSVHAKINKQWRHANTYCYHYVFKLPKSNCSGVLASHDYVTPRSSIKDGWGWSKSFYFWLFVATV